MILVPFCSYSESVFLTGGRCPGSYAVTFDPTEHAQVSFAEVWPSTDIGKRKSFSIACWIKLNSYQSNTDYKQVIYSDPARENFQLGIQYGKIFLLSSKASDGKLWMKIAYERIPIKNWTHVAAIWDGGIIKLYVDGEERDGYSLDSPKRQDSSFGESATAFIAGNPNYNFKDYQFLGSIMDLYVFGTALSRDDVTKVYKGKVH